MNKWSIGAVVFLVIVLMLFYQPVIFPMIKSFISIFNATTSRYVYKTPSYDPLSITHTVALGIVKWIYYIFTDPFALAVVIFISILIIILEMKWS